MTIDSSQLAARTFTIRQLSAEYHCTSRALRFYEDRGLLSPGRNGINRVYSVRDRARLQLILRGKRVGLSLQEIGEILDLYDLNDGGVSQSVQTLTKLRARIVTLESQRLDVDRAIAMLRLNCDALEAKLAREPGASKYPAVS